MTKIIISSILAGVVVTLWGMLAWMVLDFHRDTFKNCPDDKTMATFMLGSMQEHAVYTIPARPQTHEESAVKEYVENVKNGPIALIFFLPGGGDPTMLREVIIGILINIITAAIAGWFLLKSTAVSQSYLKRVVFIAVLAVFASLAIHFQNWNWMYFPLRYTTAMSADLIIGWILGGLVIAAFIKEKKSRENI